MEIDFDYTEHCTHHSHRYQYMRRHRQQTGNRNVGRIF